ncbi:MAG: response regulator transcription factor [Burkholderiales bacterium]|nr:response regulator transcription factor [Burkholderiales bacterium]
MTISVLVADDHPIVAEGLYRLVDSQSDMRVVAYVQDGQEAVRRAVEICPDVVLIDHAMPTLNGTEATRIIRQRCPDTRVVMLSMYSDPVHIYRALQAGAMGYLVKKSVVKEMADAIRAVYAGRRYLSQSLADSVMEHFLYSETTTNPLDLLSRRERQVLQMLAEGRAVVDIATTLSLSPKTVETYRARMMAKLGIHDLAGLVKFAIQQGMIAL